MKIVFVTLLVCFACVQFANAYHGWDPVDWRDIPKAQSDDIIDVLHIEAPLFKLQYGDLMEKFNLYHVGIGFVNRNSNVNWTLEYDALPTFFNCVAPNIVTNSTGYTDLLWHNIGGAMIYMGVNSTYWSSRQQVIATVSGDIHNKFIDQFLSTANDSFTHYNMLNVYYDWNNNPTLRKEWMHGFTCADFDWVAFDTLYKLGAKFNYNLAFHPHKNYMNYYAKEAPNLVSFDDPHHHEKIVDFFKLVEFKFKTMSFPELMLELWTLLQGDVYLRYNNDYYHVKLRAPFINFKYVPELLPGEAKYRKMIQDFNSKKITIQ